MFRTGNSVGKATKSTQSHPPLDCILCGRKPELVLEDDEEISYTFGPLKVDDAEEPTQLSQQEALYHLLQIPTDTIDTECDTNKWNSLFCGKCIERNNVVCKFLNQLEIIQRQLNALRIEIEQEFRFTIEHLGDHQNSDDIWKNALRREISKRLGMGSPISSNIDQLEDLTKSVEITVTTESQLSSLLLDNRAHEFLEEVEISICSDQLNETSIIPADENQDEPAIDNTEIDTNKLEENRINGSSKQDFLDPFSYFQELYDLRRCHISLPKLTNREINLLMNKSGPSQEYKCVFNDCPHTGNFLTAADQYKHIQANHLEGISRLDADTLLEALGNTSEYVTTTDNYRIKPRRSRKRSHNTSKRSTSDKLITKLENQGRSMHRSQISDKQEAAKLNKLQCPIQTCKLFGKSIFHSSKHLKAHIQRSHEGVTHPFFCQECQRKFTKLWEYRTHIRSVHLGQYPFKCEHCAKGFINKTYFDVHQAKHTNQKNFSCRHCDQFFKSPGGVLMHTRYAHTGERPYQCETCGKSFVSSVKLTNHIKCVHNKSSRPFICHICGKDFPIQGYLYMHMKNSHEGEKWPSKRTNSQQLQSSTRDQEVDHSYQQARDPDISTVPAKSKLKKSLKGVNSRKFRNDTAAGSSESIQQGTPGSETIASNLSKTDQLKSPHTSTDPTFLAGPEVIPAAPPSSADCNGATTVLVLDNVPENPSENVPFSAHLVGIIDDPVQYLQFLQR